MKRRLAVLFFGLWFLVSGCETAGREAVPVKDEKRIVQTRGKEILASDMSFDMDTGEIKYTLPEPALVRIRIGIKDGGALLRNLVDWKPRPAGENLEVWDKKDASGKADFSRRKDLMLVLSCLPIDTEEHAAYKGTVKGFRKAPDFRIDFPEAKGNSEEGAPVVRGVTPVRITLDQEDKAWLTGTKFEIGMYVDQLFLAEDEEGINPYTYQLNTKYLSERLHVITVNVVGYEGEIGTKSVLIYVKNK